MEMEIERRRESSAKPVESKKAAPDLAFSLGDSDLERITDDSLGFSALSEGLGFHPKSKNFATRAIDADIMPERDFIAAPEKPEPNTGPTAALAHVSTAPKTVAETFASLREIKEKQASVVEMVPPPLARRFYASLIDLFLVQALVLGLAQTLLPEGLKIALGSKGFLAATVLLIWWAYRVFAEGLGGQTLGKMLCGIITVENDSYRKPVGVESALKRSGLLLISLGLAGLPLIWSILRPQSASLLFHDRFAATDVELAPDRV